MEHSVWRATLTFQPSGTEHPWVSIVVKSLRLGALADCFKRFPLIGEIFKTVFPGLLKKLVEDTRRHEANTMDLVQKSVDLIQRQNSEFQLIVPQGGSTRRQIAKTS